jgi:ABC-type polysaccharide/polyol phosphate transport system ATPase subunit
MRIATGGKIAAEAGQTVAVTALDDVSFELKSGDSIGLIGHNGAGKSTLLRTMAGIYTPDSGRVIREGRTATVLEIGSGMDPELSGYENILRMGMLMGIQIKEMRTKIPDIEEFTELGDFLNLPVRTYSSGMTMRLMFAVATSGQPEILLVDEMFGTGDAGFQEKAKARMRDLIANAEIFVFASHDHKLLGELCDRVFELSHGKVIVATDFNKKRELIR